MRSLFEVYESISDNDERVVNNTLLAAYREKIMSACGCTPGSEIDAIDGELYLKLQYDKNNYEIYTHLFGSQNSYDILKTILKSTDIYYVVTDRLVLSGTGGSIKGADWENNINNILDLFENKRWHFVDANHKEINGKFEVTYAENSNFTGGSRDYKRLCDWLKKHATNDTEIEIHGSRRGDISVSNIDCDNVFITYTSGGCTFTNCKADKLKICNLWYVDSHVGRCFFKNTKFNNVSVYSNDDTLLPKLYFMLKGIEAAEDQIDGRYKLSGTKLSFVKDCLKNNYDVIKKNLQTIGNPSITIKVQKQKGPEHFTFMLQEDKGKYILNSI